MASISDLATAAIASSSSAAADAGTRGAFIVLEGLDRSGKTTQVKLLEQRFVEAGRPIRAMRFPGTRPPHLARPQAAHLAQTGLPPSGR